MLRILLPCCAALAASTSSPQDAAMRSSIPASGAAAPVPAVSDSPGRNSVDGGQAAQGPIPDAVSAAENPAPGPIPAPPTDTPDEARGRRALSTAFVRVGPDGHLTVELRDGTVLVLRDVVMHPRKYCGHVPGGRPGTQYCGKYADVGTARPGGATAGNAPASAASNPIGPERGASHRE